MALKTVALYFSLSTILNCSALVSLTVNYFFFFAPDQIGTGCPKETKKDPDKRLHPFCRKVPWLSFNCTVVKSIGSLMLYLFYEILIWSKFYKTSTSFSFVRINSKRWEGKMNSEKKSSTYISFQSNTQKKLQQTAKAFLLGY